MVSLTEMGWKLNVNLAFWCKLRMFPFSLSSSQLKVCWVSPEETNLHLARLPVKQDFCCTPCEFYIPNGFPTSSEMYFSKFVFIFVVKVCLWENLKAQLHPVARLSVSQVRPPACPGQWTSPGHHLARSHESIWAAWAHLSSIKPISQPFLELYFFKISIHICCKGVSPACWPPAGQKSKVNRGRPGISFSLCLPLLLSLSLSLSLSLPLYKLATWPEVTSQSRVARNREARPKGQQTTCCKRMALNYEKGLDSSSKEESVSSQLVCPLFCTQVLEQRENLKLIWSFSSTLSCHVFIHWFIEADNPARLLHKQCHLFWKK